MIEIKCTLALGNFFGIPLNGLTALVLSVGFELDAAVGTRALRSWRSKLACGAVVIKLIPSVLLAREGIVTFIKCVETRACVTNRFIFQIFLIHVFGIQKWTHGNSLDFVSNISRGQSQRVRRWVTALDLRALLKGLQLLLCRVENVVKLIFIDDHIHLITERSFKLFDNIYLMPNLFHLLSISSLLEMVVIAGTGHLAEIATGGIVLTFHILLVSPTGEVRAVMLCLS